MEKNGFSKKMQEELSYYVYALIDPRTSPSKIFYIGMGHNNRVFDHVASAEGNNTTSDKLDVIREIQRAGLSVEHIIIRHGLSKDEAFTVEAALIDLLSSGYQFDGTLTNAQKGHGHHAKGIISADELNIFRNAKPFAAMHNLLCININDTFTSLDTDSVYKAVKESWKIDLKRAKKIDYVLAEYCGHVVGVFKVEEWYQMGQPDAKGIYRLGFNGTSVEDKAIRDLYIGCKIEKKRGAQNSLRYFSPKE